MREQGGEVGLSSPSVGEGRPDNTYTRPGQPIDTGLDNTMWGETSWAPWLRAPVLHFGFMILVLIVLMLSVPAVHPDQLGDLGLASVLPFTVWLAFAALIVGYAVATSFAPMSRVLGSYVAVLSIALHSLPVLAYQYPRFPWTWKHVGVVDFIQRNNAVDPGIHTMNAFHSWPGFFGLNTLLTETGGLESSLSYAAWAPIFFNLAYLGALVLLFRTITDDHRWVWTGCLFFTVANWIGQDYFAPQALAFLFYLTVMGILLSWFPRRRRGAHEARSRDRVIMAGLVFVLLVATLVSHQLTPVMIAAAAGGLALFRTTVLRWPALVVVGLLAVWMIDFARPFTVEYVPIIMSDLVTITNRLDSGLVDFGQVDTSQRAVSLAARGLTALTVVVGGLGFLRSFRSGVHWRSILVLLVAPVILVGASSYGGEILFRAFFFALPALGLLMGALWFSRVPGDRLLWSIGSLAGMIALVFGMSIIAKHGNDTRTVFRHGEVAAASYMYETAPPGSLVVQLSTSSPLRFRNYENLVDVVLEEYPENSKTRFVDDPVAFVSRLAVDGDYTETYVLLTDSQEAAVSRLGRMPPDTYDIAATSLQASDVFEVLISNDDAWLFRYTGPER